MKIVAAALIFDGPNVLIARRAPGQNLAGFWEFPGGKLERGETLQSCLSRELDEELGLQCEVLDIFAMSEHYYEGGSIQLIALEAKILSGEIRLTVHDEVAWVHFGELLSFELPPADIPIAKAVIDFLSNKFLG